LQLAGLVLAGAVAVPAAVVAAVVTGGKPDPRKSLFLFCSGKKGSGKSYVCRAWFDAYPLDRLVIDPTHDIRQDLIADGVDFHLIDPDVIPVRLPRDEEGRRQTWVYCPDMGSPTAVDDMDRVIGLAIGRGPILVWVDEWGTVTTQHYTPPNARRVLHHGRHDDISLLIACPRPLKVDPLAIGQADKVYTFKTAVPQDRDTIAANIGYPPAEFTAANARLSVERHDYTLYDAATDELWIMPPLPRRSPRQHFPADASAGGTLVPHGAAQEAASA
jgi:hypothetical protein